MSSAIAFFGATGGSVNSCLAAALRFGYSCSALARNPSKLEAILLGKDISRSTIETQLTIIAGDVRDLSSVKRTITGVGIIVSGIGAYPRLQMSVRMPLVLKDRTICADASASILKACQEIFKNGAKPVFLVVSTAGVQEEGMPRPIPFVYRSFYYWLLADPHADKEIMEGNIRYHMKLPEPERGIGSYVLVKPSILTDGKNRGVDAVRAGTGDRPPVGYTIDREAVGQWMFYKLIQDEGATGVWKNTSVTITY